MKKIRVGVIGQGRSGYRIHVDCLQNMTDRYEIAVVADTLEGRCLKTSEEIGCDACTDYREIAARDDLDLVVNATPTHLHVPVTLDLLDAGHNVLCEKPLARCVADVDALITRAEETGRLLAIFQQSRFAPYFVQVRKVLESGLLGRLIMVKIAFNGFTRRWDWQTLQEFSGGSLLNTGPHPLDQALQLFGTDAMPEVLCIMDRANTFGDAEDHVKLILHGEGRPTIDLEISSCCAYPLYTYQLYGTHGGLSGDLSHLDWKWYVPDEAPPRELVRSPLPDYQYCGEVLPMHEDSWDVPQQQTDLFETIGRQFYTNLYDALTDGAELVVKPEHVRRQIEVIEECHRQNPLSRMS